LKPVQLFLFDGFTIRSAHLVAVDHPRPLYYDILLGGFIGCYYISKANGVNGWKPDCRQWWFSTLAEAEKEFGRSLNQIPIPIVNLPANTFCPDLDHKKPLQKQDQ
jgi:hypothetical protein